MGKRVLIVSTIVSLVFQWFFLSPVTAQTSNRTCGDADYLAGFNQVETKLSINGKDDFQVNVVTKTGEKCVRIFRRPDRSGIKASDFANQNALFNRDTDFYSYKFAGGRLVPDADPDRLDLAVEIYAIFSEDGLTKGKKAAQYQGLFFRFLYSNQIGETDKFYQTDADRVFTTFTKIGVVEVGQQEATKAMYREFYNLQGKSVEGGVVVKERVKLALDFSIDYSGSEVGTNNPPYKPNNEEAWNGKKATLPGLAGNSLQLQLWRKAPGESYFLFHKVYSQTLSSNPSDGKVSINDELAVGEYALTSFLQISFNGQVLGLGGNYTAQMLGNASQEEKLKRAGTTLDTVIGQATDEVFFAGYLGIINRGRADLFVAQSNFSVAEGRSNNHPLNPEYKFTTSTRDVFGELFGECNSLSIVFSGSFGDVFNNILQCLIKTVMEPIVTWAAGLVQSAAGLSYQKYRHEKVVTRLSNWERT